MMGPASWGLWGRLRGKEGVGFDWYLTGVNGLTLVLLFWICGGLGSFGLKERMGLGLWMDWTWTRSSII